MLLSEQLRLPGEAPIYRIRSESIRAVEAVDENAFQVPVGLNLPCLQRPLLTRTRCSLCFRCSMARALCTSLLRAHLSGTLGLDPLRLALNRLLIATGRITKLREVAKLQDRPPQAFHPVLLLRMLLSTLTVIFPAGCFCQRLVELLPGIE